MEKNKRIVCASADNLIKFQTAEEAVSDKFMEDHKKAMEALEKRKEEYRLKRLKNKKGKTFN